MSFNITPGQLARHGEFYHQLSQLLTAGLGLIPALGQLERSAPAPRYRLWARSWTAELNHGFTFSETLERSEYTLSEFDLALIHAGEQSGRLDAALRLLAEYYSERARLARQVLGDMAYPAFLLHAAVFLLPFAHAFTSGNWLGYFALIFSILIPLYAIVIIGIYAGQGRHGEGWRSFLEKILRPVPILGGARSSLALSRLCAALESLISAGVSIVVAWPLSANASGSPSLRREVQTWGQQLDAGVTPAELVSSSGKFPSLFVSQYTTGEISGSLDNALLRLRDYYREEGSRKLRAFTQWTPKLVYLAIVLVIAYKVVSFYSGYFNQVQEIEKGFGP